MENKNMFIVAVIFLVILFNSIVYGALNTDMFIDGDAYVRVDRDIRITGIKVVEQVGGAYETYNSDYSKDTTSIQVTLPNSDSMIIYEITITNKGDINYVLSELIEESYSNSNIKYEFINLEEGIVIDGRTTHTFQIKITTTGNNISNSGSIVSKYLFEELKETEWTFDYTGGEQEFKVPYGGMYKLETWGAQGGSAINMPGGYGGYSKGMINLTQDMKLFINIGQEGTVTDRTVVSAEPVYNGGGVGHGNTDKTGSSGGGATHIALISGVLSTFENNLDNLILVSGGGGGSTQTNNSGDMSKKGSGGNGGGYVGNSGSTTMGAYVVGKGGTQTEGGTGYVDAGRSQNGIGTFGHGGTNSVNGAGGGSGLYGGGAGQFDSGAGGGSGYIGNLLLSNKIMYCYNCQESNELSTKTISITNVSGEAISNYAKKGNGYAKITFIKK